MKRNYTLFFTLILMFLAVPAMAQTLVVSDATVQEGTGGQTAMTFEVRVTGFGGLTTVDWATSDGTATAASGDYDTASGIFTIPNGSTTTITVQVNGDSTDEALNETLILTVNGSGPNGLASDTGTGNIQDDDNPPTISIGPASAGEGSSLVFPVTLSNATDIGPVAASYSTTDGTAMAADSDYTAAVAAAMTPIPAGSTTGSITINTTADTKYEANETFTVTVTAGVNAVGADSDTGTILNDDTAPAVSINDPGAVSEAGAPNITFTISIPALSGLPVSGNWTTQDASAIASSDYNAASGTWTIPAGSLNTTVNVSLIDDTIDEDPGQTFNVVLSAVTNGTLADGTGVGTINDNDNAPIVTINNVSFMEGTGAGTTNAVFDLTLSAPSERTGVDATVSSLGGGSATGGGVDYTTAGLPVTVTFAPGQTVNTFTVPVTRDALAEDPEDFYVQITAVNRLTIGAQSVGSATIIDDDSAAGGLPTISVQNAGPVAEGAGLQFIATLSASYPEVVTVNYFTVPDEAVSPDDFPATAAQLSWPANSAPGTQQSFTIITVNDSIAEPAEDFYVHYTNPVNATVFGNSSTGGTEARARGRIQASDAGPVISIQNGSVLEGNAGTTTLQMNVVLSAASEQTVSVQYAPAGGTATGGTDYVNAGFPQTLTFAPGETIKVATITVNGDVAVEGNETVLVNLSAPINGTLGVLQGVGTIVDDEGVPTLSIAGDSEFENSGIDLQFIVTLSTTSHTQPVTVAYTTIPSSATGDVDYGTTFGSLTFNPGDNQETIFVEINDDSFDEDDETLEVQISSPVNAIVDPTAATALGVIFDDDSEPGIDIFTVNSPLGEGDSGTKFARFDITLDNLSADTVTVQWRTSPGTANEMEDFETTSGQATFAPGDTSVRILVPVVGDLRNEPLNEDFEVLLNGAENGSINTSSATFTITDNDPLPNITITDVTVIEPTTGTAQMTFTVSLSNASSQAVGFTWATANDTAIAPGDYVTQLPTATSIPAGQLSTTVSVTINSDTLTESTERFFVNLTAPINGAITDPQGVGTIVDSDGAPSLIIDNQGAIEGADIDFTVSLTQASVSTVTVDYRVVPETASNGGAPALGTQDYDGSEDPLTGTLTFLPGVLTQTVTIQTIDDPVYERNENFFVVLENATNASITIDQGVGTIFENESLPEWSISDVSVTEPTSGTINASFTVSVSTPSEYPVSIDWATADGTATTAEGDYVGATGTVVMPQGQIQQTVNVVVNGDAVTEGSEQFFVNLTNESDITTVLDAQGIGTINDASAPAVSIDDPVAVVEGGTINFTVSIGAPHTMDIVVTYNTANGTAVAPGDYTAESSTVTILAGTTSAMIDIVTNNDAIAENQENFQVLLVSATNATIADGAGTGLIDDTPDAQPSVSIGDVSTQEGDAGTTAFVFPVTLSGPSEQTITVTATPAHVTTDGTDFTPAAGTVTFLPGETAQDFTVQVNGDTTVEEDETFTVTLSGEVNATLGDAVATGTVLNDDGEVQISVGDVTVVEGDAGTSVMVVPVTLSQANGSTVTVEWQTVDGTATSNPAPPIPSDRDFNATSGTVTFAPGDTIEFVAITLRTDQLYEGDEQFIVELGTITSSNAAYGDVAGTVTILENEAFPRITIENVTVAEDTGAVNDQTPNGGDINVSVAPRSATPITFRWRTLNQTATAGDDYNNTNAPLETIPANTGTIELVTTIPIIDDTDDEPTEWFQVELYNITIAGVQADDAYIGDGRVTITDNDVQPNVQFSVATVSTPEGNSGSQDLVLTVNMDRASANPVTVQYRTFDGGANTADSDVDYQTTSGMLTFVPGDTTAQIRVPIFGDTIDEDPDETFEVVLENAGPNANIGANNPIVVTITDNDNLPSVSVSNVSVIEPDAGSIDAVFVLTLNRASSDPMTFYVRTEDDTAEDGDNVGEDTDYQSQGIPVAVAVTFPAGTTEVEFPVAVFGDLTPEDTETFRLRVYSDLATTVLEDTGVATILDNDSTPTVSIDDVVVTEGGTATFHVTLSIPVDYDVTVTYDTQDGTAVFGGLAASGGQDYTQTLGGSVVILAGTTEVDLTVATNDDSVWEGTENFSVQLTAVTPADPPDGGVVLGDPHGHVVLLDNETPSVLSIADVTVTEPDDPNTTPATFTVTVSPVSQNPIQFNYSTLPDTAMSPGDYVAATGLTGNIAAGSATTTFDITVNSDAIDEPQEWATVQIYNATGGAMIATESARLIIDDAAEDVPELSISCGACTIGEGDSGTTMATFTVTLAEASSQIVTVHYDTAPSGAFPATEGVDYLATSGTLTFAPGETTKTIEVPVVGDTADDNADETFDVTLSNANGAGITTPTATMTILDDENAPIVSINDTTVVETNGGEVDANLTVTLSRPSDETVTVAWETIDGAAAHAQAADNDYDADSDVLTFAPGETSKVITVKVNGDDKYENDERFQVRIHTITGPACFNGACSVTERFGNIIIKNDDDLPTISISNAVPNAVDEGTPVDFTVELSHPSEQTVTVHYQTVNVTAMHPDDYTGTNNTTLTFLPGDPLSQTFQIATIDDLADEQQENFLVNLFNPNNGLIGNDIGTARINDNDGAPSFSVTTVNSPAGEGAGYARFRVTLSDPSSNVMQVNYYTRDGASGAPTDAVAGEDYEATTGELTFAPGETEIIVRVPLIDDDLQEDVEDFDLVLSNVSTNNEITSAAFEINDNDSRPQITINDVTVVEGNNGNTTARLTISLTRPSFEVVTVDVHLDDDTATVADGDYIDDLQTVTFNPGETEKTFDVMVVGDTKLELNERLIVNLMNGVNDSGIIRDGFVFIQDDDDLPIVTINDAINAETSPDVTLTVSLSHLSSTPVDVPWNTVDNTAEVSDGDYNAQSGTVTIPANTLSATLTLTGVINDDPIDEPEENFFVHLGEVTTGNAAVGRELAVVTITDDDDIPGLSIDDVQIREGDSGGKLMTFTVTLSNVNDEIVSFKYDTADGGCDPVHTAMTTDLDYFPASGIGRIDPGETTELITVIILGDTRLENYEQFTVTLTNPVNAQLTDDTGVGTILDDEVEITLTATPNPAFAPTSAHPGLWPYEPVDLQATVVTGLGDEGCDATVDAAIVPPSGTMDFWDDTPGVATAYLGQAPVVAGVADLSDIEFPEAGMHDLRAEYSGDVWYNDGTGTAQLEMLVIGDLDRDYLVGVSDLVILANALAGNVTPGSSPWDAPVESADVDQNTTNGDTSDQVILANYLAGNIAYMPWP